MSISKPSVIFFGSFLEYSVQVLEKLYRSDQVNIIEVVTTPPRPAGRKQELKKTHVHQFALDHQIPVVTPTNLPSQPTHQLPDQPDLLVVAGYGKLLPQSWLDYPRIAPINIHFSLLPKYRGAMPGEWALLMDEPQTGVSLIEMSPKLDAGNIYAQANYPIKSTHTRESLYHGLYNLGAQLFLDTLSVYLEYRSGQVITQPTSQSAKIYLPPQPQPAKTDHIYARLLNKQDSFIPWELITAAMQGKSVAIDDLTPLMQELPTKILTQSGLAEAIERMVRALAGWPGVWTEIDTDHGKKRLKIHSCRVVSGKLHLDKVQQEGKKISSYIQNM